MKHSSGSPAGSSHIYEHLNADRDVTTALIERRHGMMEQADFANQTTEGWVAEASFLRLAVQSKLTESIAPEKKTGKGSA